MTVSIVSAMKGIDKKILKRQEKHAERREIPTVPAPKHHVTDKLPWRAALRERCAEMRAVDDRQRAERLAAASHLEPVFTTTDTYVPPAVRTYVPLPHETNVPLEFLADEPMAGAVVQDVPVPVVPPLVADTYEPPEAYELEVFEEPGALPAAPAPVMLAGADEPEHFFDDSFEFEQTPVPDPAASKHYLSSLQHSLQQEEEEVLALAALKPVGERGRTGGTTAPKPALSASAISALANRSRRAPAIPQPPQRARLNVGTRQDYLHPNRTFIGAF